MHRFWLTSNRKQDERRTIAFVLVWYSACFLTSTIYKLYTRIESFQTVTWVEHRVIKNVEKNMFLIYYVRMVLSFLIKFRRCWFVTPIDMPPVCNGRLCGTFLKF